MISFSSPVVPFPFMYPFKTSVNKSLEAHTMPFPLIYTVSRNFGTQFVSLRKNYWPKLMVSWANYIKLRLKNALSVKLSRIVTLFSRKYLIFL